MQKVDCAEDVEVRRFTRKEYQRMLEVGILYEGEKVELIDGEILRKKVKGRLHNTGVRRTQAALQRVFGSDRFVQSQLTIAPDDYSEPEPDLAVLPGPVEDFEGIHPKTALLVVEIAVTSLRFDRGRKASLYARGGILEYWILNLVDGRLEVHRDPAPDPTAPLGWRYTSIQSLGPGERITPLAAHEAIEVFDLLPRSVLEGDT